MTGSDGKGMLDCEQAREAIHALLDADLVDADVKHAARAHLAGCATCREFEADLRETQTKLRSLPELVLPERAFQEVLDRTVRASRSNRPAQSSGWRQFAAAAAVLFVAMLAVWQGRESHPTGPTERELRQAAAEVQMALGLTSGAIRRTQQAAIREVLVDEVSPALKKVPIAWPGQDPDPQREI